MKRSIYAIGLLIIFSACSGKKIFYLSTASDEYVSKHTKLFCKNVEVGEVEKVSYYNGRVLLQCSMKERSFKLSDRFYLDYRNPKTVTIEISPGGEGEELSSGDTVIDDLKFRAINDPKAIEMIQHMQERVGNK